MATKVRGRKRPIKMAHAGFDPVRHQKIIKANSKLAFSIHNRFDIEVVDARIGEVKQRVQAENTISNALWTRLFTPASYFNYIHFGTGSGSPSSTDASLFAFLGSKAVNTPTYAYNWDDGWVSLRQQCNLSEMEYIGNTLTEIGVAYESSSSTLVTHAMLKDMNGNQISIQKTDTDIINIFATIFVHWDVNGYGPAKIQNERYYGNFFKYFLGVQTLGGGGNGTDNSTGRFMFYKGGLAPTEQVYRADDADYTNKTYAAVTVTYSASTKAITFKANRLSAPIGNLGGIIKCAIGYGYYYGGNGNTRIPPSISIDLGDWYPGTSIVGEAIGTGNGSAVDYATSYPFISDAIIYVEGVAQTSGVSIDFDVPLTPTDMGIYFDWLPRYSANSGSGFLVPTATSLSGAYAAYYNPHYALGITQFRAYTSSTVVAVSDDLSTWSTVSTGASGIVSVPVQYRNYKYWRISGAAAYEFTSENVKATNIHFDTPPAAGAVITADYTTKTIAKDANHVFDLTVTIQLGEYTE